MLKLPADFSHSRRVCGHEFLIALFKQQPNYITSNIQTRPLQSLAEQPVGPVECEEGYFDSPEGVSERATAAATLPNEF